MCEAVLRDFSLGSVKWPTNEEESMGGYGSDDEVNEDMAVGIDPYTYRYNYHAHGQPLFSNVHELIWEHATPEILSVTSPSIRVLRLPEDVHRMENGRQTYEYGYRVRRHAFKQMLPAVLQALPSLEELELRKLAHEAFWYPFWQSVPSGRFGRPGCNLDHPWALITLEINMVERGGMPWNLKRLFLKGWTTGAAAVTDAIVAPGLEDVEIWYKGFLEEGGNDVLAVALHATFDTLRRRNAGSLQKLSLVDIRFSQPLFTGRTTTATLFHPVAGPLLALQHLQDVAIEEDTFDINVPGLVAAWPTVRSLDLPCQYLTFDSLREIARTCPQLECLKVWALEDGEGTLDDLRSQAAQQRTSSCSDTDSAPDSEATGCALRELHVDGSLYIEHRSDINIIARFLDSLFPQLDVGRSSQPVVFDGDDPEDGAAIMKEVTRLQHARQNQV
ncbi:uncharacterized protein B0H18DRAFT_1107947 [Fomitopsis serialis]|uniref:uncharacterized protein n=1 Tax=Fomitopsis serialis TaxID=139415 RepID=UPI002007AA6B|nr:uncharacterized protein B0H18DRAFT_1107947 [Neoantrodia serialis]KAH9915528.1 hypothetical protein B0H18DRAFT_1107947 [Neoantrodia serialis]